MFIQVFDEISDVLIVLIFLLSKNNNNVYWGIFQLIIIIVSQIFMLQKLKKFKLTKIDKFFVAIGFGRIWLIQNHGQIKKFVTLNKY